MNTKRGSHSATSEPPRKSHVKTDAGLANGLLPQNALSALLRRRFADRRRPTLVAVGGPGGIGKSTFAAALAQTLGEAVVLGLDDFSIFIDAHWRTQLHTRIERDILERGYTPRKAIETFLHSNLLEFETYGASSKNWADVHLHCDAQYRLTAAAICSTLAPYWTDS